MSKRIPVRIAGSIVAAAFLIYFAGIYSQNYYLPIDKWNTGEEYGEQIGLDGFTCRKIQLTEGEASLAIKKLGLADIEKLSDAEVYSAVGCNAKWWDVTFPRDAKYQWYSDSGQERKLALYENGYLYYTAEIW